jgi:hypothetical protein
LSQIKMIDRRHFAEPAKIGIAGCMAFATADRLKNK